MDEIMIYRAVIVSTFFWFLISELIHWRQLKKAYRDGFAKALGITIDDLKNIYFDMNSNSNEGEHDQPGNAQIATKERND